MSNLLAAPWKLYLASRPRRRFRNIPSAPDADNHHIRLAESELRTHEVSYLTLTLLAPFLGAFLLRKVVSTVSGDDAMHWFSTSLFVLATGVRPWSHFISRLRQRTRDLHDTIHYPSPETQLIADGQLQAILKRMESLERELKTVKRVMAVDRNVNQTHEEMYGAIEDVERVIKRQERKSEVARTSSETRIAQLETTISRLEAEKQRPADAAPGALVRQLMTDLFEIPHAVWTKIAVGHLRDANSSFIRGEKQHTGHTVKRSNSRLETIPECGDENNVVFVTASGPKIVKRRKMSRPQPLQSEPKNSGSIRDRLVEVMFIPYHFSIRLLVALFPPLQKLFS